MGQPHNGDHPRIRANLLSVIFYIFTFDTFRRGYKKLWNSNNLYETIAGDKSEVLGDEIERMWTEEKQNATIEKRPATLIRIIFKMFWCELFRAAILLVIAQIVLRLIEPLLLGRLLKYFKQQNSISKEEALRCGFYIVAVIGTRIVFYSQYKIHTYKTALRVRVSCSTLIYRKVLNLSVTSLQQTTSGQIVNFISYDLNRFDTGTDLIHFVWVAPIFVLSIIYILYLETGFSGLVGVIWFSFVAMLQSYNGTITASIYGKRNRKSGNRLRIMNEIITGIQVIKMYAWEKSFIRLISSARNEELISITKLNYVRNIFLSFSSIFNHLSLFFTLYVLIWMKESITSAKVYGLVVYYGVLNFIVSIMFILAISKSVEIWKTIKRLNEFLLKDEFKPISSLEGSDGIIIQLDDVEARWNSSTSLCSYKQKMKTDKAVIKSCLPTETERLMNRNSSRVVLQHITLALRRGNLMGIIGPVGSGKSSLLQTILGELELTSGKMKVQNSVSYTSQDDWIFAGTVKENILFGEEYDANRYGEVLRVCCLERDLEIFTDGDLTLVGDRGTSLSGGQKSRINLARAIYRQRNIYLLDDPLSAVDVQVSKHIYQECIEGFLKDKCRILVTHHINHLRNCNYIIVLNQGRIEDSGTYNDLIQRGSIGTSKSSVQKKLTDIDTPKILQDEAYDIIDDLGESTCDRHLHPEKLDISSSDTNYTKQERNPLIYFFWKETNWLYFILVFCLFTFIQILVSTTDFFLSGWVNNEEFKNQSHNLKNSTIFHIYFPKFETTEYLYIYGSLICIIASCNIVRSFLYVNFFRALSKKLHDNMFSRVIHATMQFFDCTSSGQILTRFSLDMQATDEFIPRTVLEALVFINSLLAAIVVVLLLNPYIVVMVAIMSVKFILISFFFMRTSRNLKEVECSLMSPILSHLGESIQGLITIRGLGAQKIAQKKFTQFLDRYTSSWYMLATAFGAFGFYVEFVSFLFTSTVTLSLIFIGKDLHLTPSEVGLAVTQSMVLSALVQYGVLNCAQINQLLVSIRRILEYNSIPQETDPINPILPPLNWPKNGQIVFKNVSVKYSACKPSVLRNLNFIVDPCEKVGIVGRTGAGKSSLLSALFKLVKISGEIEIDEIDIDQMSLHTIRSKLSIIPQDPVLFNGTLRFNLDPFDEYDDNVLYEALKAVGLNSATRRTKNLHARVTDGGSNFSVGQRQQICLARATIRKNKIVILDEATANIDYQTDLLIQTTMKKQFSDCTVLTVAHRLSTVIDSDKILVIESGELVEIGHPYVLISNVKGKFHSMVTQTGSSMAEHLKNIAFRAYEEKMKTNRILPEL